MDRYIDEKAGRKLESFKGYLKRRQRFWLRLNLLVLAGLLVLLFIPLTSVVWLLGISLLGIEIYLHYMYSKVKS